MPHEGSVTLIKGRPISANSAVPLRLANSEAEAPRWLKGATVSNLAGPSAEKHARREIPPFRTRLRPRVGTGTLYIFHLVSGAWM